MYANVVTVTIDAGEDPQAARTALQEQVVPRVASHPGFAGGYWLAPVDGKGLALTLWESEEEARDAARLADPGSSPMAGVTVERVETREVVVKGTPVLRERVRQLSRQRHELLERARQVQRQQRELLARAQRRRQERRGVTTTAPPPADSMGTDVEH